MSGEKLVGTTQVWLQNTSVAITHEVVTSYNKGLFFCVREASGRVIKYPIDHIFRVIETPIREEV